MNKKRAASKAFILVGENDYIINISLDGTVFMDPQKTVGEFKRGQHVVISEILRYSLSR